MTRRCSVTGKGPLVGHLVSHANNKTKRRFLPNLQNVSVLSETLGQTFRMRLSTSAIRTIEHKGGFDAYLIGTKDIELSSDARRIKHRIEKARSTPRN
ncbi:MAG: 50S ribosomal protein L28 [Alphaproteobacteria bacterium]